jgi:hypothetical protein
MNRNIRCGIALLLAAVVCLSVLGISVLASFEPAVEAETMADDPVMDASSDTDAVVTSTPSPTPQQPSSGTDAVTRPVKGDINGDGTVDLKDVEQLFQYVNGQNGNVDTAVSDINGDGAIDLKDVTRLFQYVNGQTSTL